MKRHFLFITLLFSVTLSLPAQTLFTYAGKSVSVNEYIRAFNKVYPAPVTSKDKKIKEYLNLYINSRLKTHEAMMRGYDTLPGFLEEYAALRNQVADNYMNDPESMNKLVEEAFTRSQKDIKLLHIFIPFNTTANTSDSNVAKLKAQEAFMALSAGKSFEETALKYSADPSVKENKGNLGYITVFSLPYRFENVIYSLAPGKYCSPYKSNSGYHIFKNGGERKALGRMKASQILLAFPPGSSAEVKDRFAQLADSLYQQIQKGADFVKLAQAFSNDNVSAASGGVMPEFSVGSFDPEFENIVFALPSNGAVSKPFLTKHGYHIVKRISLTPPPSVKNKKNLDAIREKVDKDPRVAVSKDILIKKIMDKAGFKMANLDQSMLKTFVDSSLEYKQPPKNNTIKNDDAVFSISSTSKRVADFIIYGQNNRMMKDGSGVKSYNQLLEEFKQQAAMEYYRDHLEDFNEEFARQMKELKDGNLFFDIMMKEVWSKAQTDSTGQLGYYNRNKSKYAWKKSADAVTFYCSDDAIAQSLRTALQKNPAEWKSLMENFTDRATADSARFETVKIPGASATTTKSGTITAIIKNKDDNSASFAYIIRIYNQPSQKTFAEARGEVVSDYQDELDKKWIGELKKKYPVKINEEALKSIAK